MMHRQPTIRILGIRGIPAAHGGFETFAERLALYLVDRGWRVIVYCQEEGRGETSRDVWKGVERVHVPVPGTGAFATMHFDLLSILHARKSGGLCLTLGYNTACFWPLLRVKGIRHVANMDGIEWRRAKWSRPVKLWFWMNDWFGCWNAHHLIADHPEIEKLLTRRVKAQKVTQIAYGADRVEDVAADAIAPFGLESRRFMTLIARPEPENSVLECVQGFSARRRGIKLVVLGAYSRENEYHRQVLEAASDEVVFPGAIYDKRVVQALRSHCIGYMHGHQVGGSNPSLIEAIGAGNAILAHDNVFNRWVTDESALFFRTADDVDAAISRLTQTDGLGDSLRKAAVAVFDRRFTWPAILSGYENCLRAHLPEEQLGTAEAGTGVAVQAK